MILTSAHEQVIDRSVLCWLATVSEEGIPNVSPKECFAAYSDDKIIIANIASPQSVRNIKANSNVCLSFIDIFLQKGYKVIGEATIVDEHNEADFLPYKAVLDLIIHGKFPYRSVIEISIEKISDIKAPSYIFYPNKTEQDMIDNAKEAYGVERLY